MGLTKNNTGIKKDLDMLTMMARRNSQKKSEARIEIKNPYRT